MSIRNILLGAGLLLLALTGCRPRVTISYTKPAQVDLKGIKRIAVGGVLGPVAHIPESVIIKTDLESAIYNSGRFELVEKKLTADSLTRIGFVYNALFDETSASKLAKTIPDSVLVFAIITDYQEGTKVDTASDGTKYRTNFVDIYGEFQMIESETGHLIATKRLRGYASEQIQLSNSLLLNAVNTVGSYQQIHTAAQAQIANEFIKMIVPYPASDTVKLAKGRPESQTGGRYIAANNWDAAIQTLEGGLAAYPNDHQIMYNLGIAYQYTYQFDKAVPMLEKAYATGGKKMYVRQLESCKQMQAEQARLQQQLIDNPIKN
jgi:tetratricopeptide (TPR) repeat protein